MSCCTVAGTQKYFNESAGYYATKFRRRGPDRAQRLMVGALRSLGIKEKSVLDAGCGVGGLLLTLLSEGAATAFGVEVSDAMLAKARELADEKGYSSRARYLAADFAQADGSIPRSDIVVLDKVLCCYADPGALIARAAGSCNQLLAVSYPKDAWLPRLGFKWEAFIGRMLRRPFHPLYHEPQMLDASISSYGFSEVYSGATIIWRVKVFERIGNRENE